MNESHNRMERDDTPLMRARRSPRAALNCKEQRPRNDTSLRKDLKFTRRTRVAFFQRTNLVTIIVIEGSKSSNCAHLT